jgi:hypothetical protein
MLELGFADAESNFSNLFQADSSIIFELSNVLICSSYPTYSLRIYRTFAPPSFVLNLCF